MECKCELQWQRVMAEFEKGDYREHRIPGIVVTEKGTILCCCEGRMDENSDWGRIDIVIRRSADDGNTWQTGVVRIPGMEKPIKVSRDNGILITDYPCEINDIN